MLSCGVEVAEVTVGDVGKTGAIIKKTKLCILNTAPIYESGTLFNHYRLAIYIMLSAAIRLHWFLSLIFFPSFFPIIFHLTAPSWKSLLCSCTVSAYVFTGRRVRGQGISMGLYDLPPVARDVWDRAA